MTTSDQEQQARQAALAAQAARAQATNEVTQTDLSAVNLPDFLQPSILTELANSFFKEVPINSQSAENFVGSYESVSLPTFSEPVSTNDLNGATNALTQITDSSLGQDFSTQQMPVDFGANSVFAAPSFSFLEEIRPLFNAGGNGLPLASVGAPQIPGSMVHPAGFPAAMPTGFSENDYSEFLPGFPSGVPTGLPVDSRSDFQTTSSYLKGLEVLPILQSADSYGLNQPSISGLQPSLGQFDVQAIRRDFPILEEIVDGRKLIWLDNAATTQKPKAVIDRLKYFYEHENSNVHRAAHTLAARSTDAYEKARESVSRFLNASSPSEIIFVRGATEGINLIAQSWGRQNIKKDDEIVISWLEHHANIVPWQMLCAEKGAKLRVAPVDDHGQILLDEYERLLGPKTKLVSFTQVSNALGTVTPVQQMVESAHRYGAKVLVDGAQAVSHMGVDVQMYDCDFYVFSGHKVFGPTGIGAVFAKAAVLEGMPPWQGGGNMIQDVTFERTLYQAAPLRFEAGTGNIADAIGLGAALDYLQRIGMNNIARHEHDLLVYATNALKQIPGLRIIGNAADKAGVLSFTLEGYKTEEVSSALSREGIAVRGGHHCAQPILRRFGLESSVRPSFALYNTCEEIDALAIAVWNLKQGRGIGPR
ncbi:MAG: family 2A encapsulin nanocompartment cargo protein cysteine desulfurase [Candidatus Obscuribacterales bacterium]|nr:family 2A encapsulin nanocompartment cargo protein cysteine desulfurase [Candidatus Obscuribacterales bacterium]